MMARRTVPILSLALFCASCYDFAAPDFPGAGANPVLQLNVLLNEQGSLSLSGLFAPGIGLDGFQRRVPRDTLDVFGLNIGPSAVESNGVRVYGFVGHLPATVAATQPLELRAPEIESFPALPPGIRWFGIRRVDPDTIYWRPGTALVLHVDTAVGVSVPTPRIREWFLELRSTSNSFRVSSDGWPPAELRIPAEWVPPTTTSDIIGITMSFHQSSRVEPATANYPAFIDYTYLVSWVLVVLRT